MEENTKKVCLIDADSLAYLGTKEDTLPQILEKVDYKIQSILEETKADYYALFLSKGKYFRHNIKERGESSGTYKANRIYNNQNYNKVIKEYLQAQYDANVYPNVEADDIISYWMNKKIAVHTDEDDILLRGLFYSFEANSSIDNVVDPSPHSDVNAILASIDKDLLQSIPGKHLNYNKKVGPEEWGMEWVETTEAEADDFIRMQMYVGDTSDGVSGIPRKGIKYYEKISEEVKPSWGDILLEYQVYYGQSQGIYEFQKNYRLLHLLDCDEDFMREVGYIPELPRFLKVNKNESMDVTFD